MFTWTCFKCGKTGSILGHYLTNDGPLPNCSVCMNTLCPKCVGTCHRRSNRLRLKTLQQKPKETN